MYLDYSIVKTINEYFKILKNNTFFKATITSLIIFGILLIINNKRKNTKYIVLILNLILIVSIINYYGLNIFDGFDHYINNIYGYFFNSIVFLILITVLYFNKINKIIVLPFYILSLINLIFSLYMTNYLSNNVLFVIGNIFPMIKFGNYTYITFLITLLVMLVYKQIKRRIYE